MSPARTTSIRLKDKEYALLDAYAQYLNHKTGIPVTRTDAFRGLLKAVEPASELGQEAGDWRRAYKTLFGEPS